MVSHFQIFVLILLNAITLRRQWPPTPVGHRDEVGDAKGLTTNPPTQTDASTDCIWGDVGETDLSPRVGDSSGILH